MTKIENETQYDWVVKRVEALLPLVDDDTPRDNPNSIELELLSNMVADYSEISFYIASKFKCVDPDLFVHNLPV
jgi:HTH-type transcriptional regulator/antitoxin HigA